MIGRPSGDDATTFTTAHPLSTWSEQGVVAHGRYAPGMEATSELKIDNAGLERATIRVIGIATRKALGRAGVDVLEVPFADRPVTAPLIAVVADSDGSAAIVQIVTKLSPPLVFFVDDTSDESPTVAFHLAWSDSWITIECSREVPGGTSDEGAAAVSEQRGREIDQLLADAVDQLVADDEPKAHDDYRALSDVIIGRVTAAHVLTEGDLEHLRTSAWGSADALFLRLTDLHREKLFSEAGTYAAQIFAAGEIPQNAKMDVIRAAAYRYMKRLDPKCVIKSELGSVNAALEALVRAQQV